MRNSKGFLITGIMIILMALGALIIQYLVITAQSSSLPLDAQFHIYPLYSFSSLFKQMEMSVVQITSEVHASNISNPLAENITLGSGFVYDNLGRIITTSNVVRDTKVVDVTFVNGNRYRAKVIGNDIYNDIAVLQVINITQALKPLIIGNSSKLEVGDKVVAIGNPFGLSDTLTTGIVSQVGPILPDPISGLSIPGAIQTDMPINPGNSGAPLLNMQGQVIGINIATDLSGLLLPDPISGLSIPATIQTDMPINPIANTDTSYGVGFAIPSNTILRIVPTLIEKGYYIHPYLGLSGVTLTSDLAATIDNLSTNFKGIYVDSITKDGPADKAGIHGSTTDQYSKKHGGDIITGVDGHTVTRIDDLTSYIDEHKSAGNTVVLTIHRNGQTLNLQTILTASPSTLSYLQMVPSQPHA